MTPMRAWVTLALVSALFFIITATTFSSLGLVLPAMVEELHWSWGEAGTGFSLLGVFCGITSYVPAAAIRRFGVRFTFLSGAAVMVLAFVCLSRAQGLWLYFAGTALAGFGFTLLATVPGTYLLARLFARPSFAFGLYFTIGGLGGVAGPPLYFWIAGTSGAWRDYWFVAGLLVAAVAVVVALFADAKTDVSAAAEADPEISREAWSVPAAIRTPQFVFLAIAYSAFLICGITASATSVAHLGQHGVTAVIAGSLMSLEALLNAAARLMGGILSALVGAKTLLVIALAALVVGLVALAFGRDLPSLIVYAAGIGIGYGLTFFASTILLLDYYGRAPNLELFSLVNLVSTVGSAAPVMAGFTRDQTGSFTPFYLALAVLMTVITAIALLLKPPHARVRA